MKRKLPPIYDLYNAKYPLYFFIFFMSDFSYKYTAKKK